ncbi:hypothetical protein [Albibacillus kandeliae]|uniref:hypothetical protein n=1 Tax=Albibacillus kandeliae TaxID=2174228 RepID=UPI001300374D|nr:hypothetical protein [Albibacillus kandeliae]
MSQPEIGKIVAGPKFRNNDVIFKVEVEGWVNWYPADRIHPVANLLCAEMPRKWVA